MDEIFRRNPCLTHRRRGRRRNRLRFRAGPIRTLPSTTTLRAQGVSADGIISHARTSIAGYKVPKTVDFRTEPLPLSGAMKVLKRELREPFWKGKGRGIN